MREKKKWMKKPTTTVCDVRSAQPEQTHRSSDDGDDDDDAIDDE